MIKLFDKVYCKKYYIKKKLRRLMDEISETNIDDFGICFYRRVFEQGFPHSLSRESYWDGIVVDCSFDRCCEVGKR